MWIVSDKTATLRADGAVAEVMVMTRAAQDHQEDKKATEKDKGIHAFSTFTAQPESIHGASLFRHTHAGANAAKCVCVVKHC